MDQYEEFMRVAGDRFGVYPGGVSRRTVQNSIGWRLDQWELVESHTIQIPYFDGIEWDMPYILLRERSTGARGLVRQLPQPLPEGQRPVARGGDHPARPRWPTGCSPTPSGRCSSPAT